MSRTYEEGVKDGMREQIMEDLESAAMHIEILEADLAVERTKKWNAVNKLKMIDAHKGNIGMLRYALEEGEQLTLHDKIEMIKERRIRLTTINNKRMNLQQPPQIRVGSEIYILTPMKKLRAGDVFYVKRRLLSKDDRGAVKGRYTYKEGAIKESLDGALLWNCNIKTECGKRFNYNHKRFSKLYSIGLFVVFR